ncbi:hypothetical protein LTR74_018376 [Friedmanniomyces endolithicus]|nr:hypothetical protein LTR74_018376 [Friedmanniomyces endolithicus]
MSTPFLLTGVTGGLRAKILDDMLHVHHVPAFSIIATSRSASNKERFESQGLQFRAADYFHPETLLAAFENVENLLFMSSSERYTPKRNAEHTNVVEAAKANGVKRVWYVSLALGGFDNHSRIGFQQAHYATEAMLRDSGLNYISLRAGVYSDAFPLFLNWYPSAQSVLLPNLKPPVTHALVAWTSRDELGEGIAAILAKGLEAHPSISPQTDRNIVVLTGPRADPPIALVNALNNARGTHIPVEFLEPRDWIEACAKDDEGGKGTACFETRLVWMQGVCNGDAKLIDPALETLLDRRPETGPEMVEKLVRADPVYTWHQNHKTLQK